MIVVAIIGILAAIALPAYQNYTIRAKVTEAVVAGSPAKEILSEAFQTNGVSGMDAAAAALTLFLQASAPANMSAAFSLPDRPALGRLYLQLSLVPAMGSPRTSTETPSSCRPT